MIVLTLGDGSDEHFTYPPSGRFHVTPHDSRSGRSFLEPGPSYDNLAYHPLATVAVPCDPTQLTRAFKASTDELRIAPPTSKPGLLEIGILGQQATEHAARVLGADGAEVGFYRGPRSDTTIVLRYRHAL